MFIDQTSASDRFYFNPDKIYNKYELYSHQTEKLTVMFIYGKNFQRKRDIFIGSTSVLLVTTLVVLFMALCSITLYIIRRNFNLPHGNITLSIMDCLIPFIGGGNLRMEHRFERWFFGILLFGAFFIMAVFGGDLLDTIVQIHSSKIATFDDLAKVNVTHIAASSEMRMYTEEIFGMLR